MAETPQKGIGAALHIDAETKAFRDFFATLRNAGVQTIDPQDAHVTLVDCAETQVPVFSERDQLSLNRARGMASEFLATMPYYELVLSPEEPKLAVFGRRVGIVIAQQEFVLGLRDYIGNIFNNEAGIHLSSRDYVPHLSVGLKTRGINNAAKRVRNERIPRNMHVRGHDVSERLFVHDASRARSKQSYVNGRHLRSVS